MTYRRHNYDLSGVKQFAARRAHNPKVAGSNPAPPHKISDIGASRLVILATVSRREITGEEERPEINPLNIASKALEELKFLATVIPSQVRM